MTEGHDTADGVRPPFHRVRLTGDERDRLQVLQAATEVNAPSYLAILSVFAVARERYQVELATDEVVAGLSGSDLDLDRVEGALGQLEQWGNVSRAQDTARVSRLEDFRRRRSIWQLTAAGQAAHGATVAVLGADDTRGSLQRTLFREIRTRLAELGQALDDGDAESVYLRLRELDGSLRDLAANARDFHAAVAQLRRDNDADPERFLAYKHALITYLEEFLEHLLTERARIARAVNEVAERGVDRLVALAARGDDSTGVFAAVDLEGRWRDKWSGLSSWFVDTAGRPTGAAELEAATTRAIRDLLDMLRRVSESPRRPITRASELVVLARWFRRLPDEDGAAELFDAAFGLGRPLHLGLAEADPEATAPSRSWWDADPVEVPMTLREHGKRPSPGRSGRVADYSATKAHLAAEHREARRARVEAAARLSARPVAGRVLSAAETAVFFELLDRAAHQRPVGAQQWRASPVVVEGAAATLVPDPDGMVVRTVRGTLTVEGHRLDLRRIGDHTVGDVVGA